MRKKGPKVTKALVLLHTRDDLDWAAFQRYWREKHRPIALRQPGLRRYTENHAPDVTSAPYGVAERWFDDPAFRTALTVVEDPADLASFVDLDKTGMTVVSEVLTWRDPPVAPEADLTDHQGALIASLAAAPETA